METDNKNIKGAAVECYNYDSTHRVLVVRSYGGVKHYFFFFIPNTPLIDFGDTILMNFAEDKYKVFRGNSKLTFNIHPQNFPNTLLWELVAERLD